jgi:hypothetical protein
LPHRQGGERLYLWVVFNHYSFCNRQKDWLLVGIPARAVRGLGCHERKDCTISIKLESL